MKMILPKSAPDLVPYFTFPLFFLAGPEPRLGTEDWRVEMTRLLTTRVDNCIIVNPTQYEEECVSPSQLTGETRKFEHHTAWARYYMHQAAEQWPLGCLIFWLSAVCSTPNALYTYDAIGEWRGRLLHNSQARVVMGGDADFPGLRIIKRNNENAVGDRLPFFQSMEEVASRAVFRASLLEKS